MVSFSTLARCLLFSAGMERREYWVTGCAASEVVDPRVAVSGWEGTGDGGVPLDFVREEDPEDSFEAGREAGKERTNECVSSKGPCCCVAHRVQKSPHLLAVDSNPLYKDVGLDSPSIAPSLSRSRSSVMGKGSARMGLGGPRAFAMSSMRLSMTLCALACTTAVSF